MKPEVESGGREHPFSRFGVGQPGEKSAARAEHVGIANQEIEAAPRAVLGGRLGPLHLVSGRLKRNFTPLRARASAASASAIFVIPPRTYHAPNSAST
jgi:hypothetical protein